MRNDLHYRKRRKGRKTIQEKLRAAACNSKDVSGSKSGSHLNRGENGSLPVDAEKDGSDGEQDSSEEEDSAAVKANMTIALPAILKKVLEQDYLITSVKEKVGILLDESTRVELGRLE
jgi:hypothetical protein